MTEGESLAERVVRLEVAFEAIEKDIGKLVHDVADISTKRDTQHGENSRRLSAIEQLLAGDRVRRDLFSRAGEWIVRIAIAFGAAAFSYFARDWTGHH